MQGSSGQRHEDAAHMAGGDATSEEEPVVAVDGCNNKHAADNERTRNKHLASPCILSLTTKFED